MTDGIDAREAVLGRIRRAIEGGVPVERSWAGMAAEWETLPRGYQRDRMRNGEEILALLEDRLKDYDANVERVPEHGVVDAIRRRLRERSWPRMIVPDGLPAGWMPSEVEVTVDADFSPRQLDAYAGVLTEATLAIALTGTLVLQNVAGQGRRAVSLVPDYHLCVVRESDVVETVAQAMERLQATSRLPTTFISGPSATADIEMTRIKGVHGPRELDVLLVSRDGAESL